MGGAKEGGARLGVRQSNDRGGGAKEGPWVGAKEGPWGGAKDGPWGGAKEGPWGELKSGRGGELKRGRGGGAKEGSARLGVRQSNDLRFALSYLNRSHVKRLILRSTHFLPHCV